MVEIRLGPLLVCVRHDIVVEAVGLLLDLDYLASHLTFRFLDIRTLFYKSISMQNHVDVSYPKR